MAHQDLEANQGAGLTQPGKTIVCRVIQRDLYGFAQLAVVDGGRVADAGSTPAAETISDGHLRVGHPILGELVHVRPTPHSLSNPRR